MPPFTTHGGSLQAAIAQFGGRAADWLDLSTGLNPHPWPGARRIAPDWRPLPDPAALAALEQAAAHHFGCAAANVCAVPGSELGLRLLGGLLPGPACHRMPAYGTHAAMVAASTPLTDAQLAQDASHSLILANPANPDGRLWPRATMQQLLHTRPPGAMLVVDEAYADCHPEASVAPLVADGAPLVVLRSFGKFFGLAGLRLGFVLAPTALLARLRARLGAWPLSTAAIAIGTAAYRDQGWIAATRTRLPQLAAELDALLRAAGHQPQGATPLFRTIDCADAGQLFRRLARHHILSRPFAGQPRRLRIGLAADAAARARLAAALG